MKLVQFLVFIFLFYSSVIAFAYLWQDEIYIWLANIFIYIKLSFVCALWIAHFGSETFTFTYRINPEDDYTIIEFPSINNLKR